MIFAVVTTSSVLVYDTQHAHPIARIGGCHLATINDAGKCMCGLCPHVASFDIFYLFICSKLGVRMEKNWYFVQAMGI